MVLLSETWLCWALKSHLSSGPELCPQSQDPNAGEWLRVDEDLVEQYPDDEASCILSCGDVKMQYDVGKFLTSTRM